jgi:hypothetical protein
MDHLIQVNFCSSLTRLLLTLWLTQIDEISAQGDSVVLSRVSYRLKLSSVLRMEHAEVSVEEAFATEYETLAVTT